MIYQEVNGYAALMEITESVEIVKFENGIIHKEKA